MLPEAVAFDTARPCARLLPSPARGREAAERGMKRPLAAVGLFVVVVARLSSENCSTLPLKFTGSE